MPTFMSIVIRNYYKIQVHRYKTVDFLAALFSCFISLLVENGDKIIILCPNQGHGLSVPDFPLSRLGVKS